jgi:hypothetical protein
MEQLAALGLITEYQHESVLGELANLETGGLVVLTEPSPRGTVMMGRDKLELVISLVSL